MAPAPTRNLKRRIAAEDHAAIKAHVPQLAVGQAVPLIESIGITEMSELVSSIRVVTHDNGVHYYTVKVTESW